MMQETMTSDLPLPSNDQMRRWIEATTTLDWWLESEMASLMARAREARIAIMNDQRSALGLNPGPGNPRLHADVMRILGIPQGAK